jgi:CheY-like chemotaxis protein
MNSISKLPEPPSPAGNAWKKRVMTNLSPKASQRRISSNASIPPRTSNARILIVEDDRLLREIYAMLLRLEDYEIEEAANGLEALECLGRSRFDLVITDRRMPKLGGIEFIRKLRNQGSNVPIVMISGSLCEAGLPADVAQEVSVALPKPASAEQISAAVEFALKPDPQDRLRLLGHSRFEEVLAADMRGISVGEDELPSVQQIGRDC